MYLRAVSAIATESCECKETRSRIRYAARVIIEQRADSSYLLTSFYKSELCHTMTTLLQTVHYSDVHHPPPPFALHVSQQIKALDGSTFELVGHQTKTLRHKNQAPHPWDICACWMYLGSISCR